MDAVIPGLRRERFAIVEATSGEEALERFDALRPDAVLLDTTIPGMSAIECCRIIRERSPVPILMLSVWRDDADLIVALEVGADAYLTPPFRMRELVARVRGLIRRASDTTAAPRVLVAGGIRLDVDRREVRAYGDPVLLAPHEFGILEMLMANPGRLVTRQQLIDRVWHGAVAGDMRTVDVQVNTLRSKVEQQSRRPPFITTIRGLGYRLDAVEQIAEQDGG